MVIDSLQCNEAGITKFGIDFSEVSSVADAVNGGDNVETARDVVDANLSQFLNLLGFLSQNLESQKASSHPVLQNNEPNGGSPAERDEACESLAQDRPLLLQILNTKNEG